MAAISDFEGIDLGNAAAAVLVDASLSVAHTLQQSIVTTSGDVQLQVGVSRFALIAAMSASTAMLAFASATCTLGQKAADINVTTDSDGNLVLRCGHSPPHEWSYSTGQKQ